MSDIIQKVSIPFKRESISKEWVDNVAKLKSLKFQFPSNGKAYPKTFDNRDYSRNAQQMFQFPSNGKAYPKLPPALLTIAICSVSIPFKRESISKETPF